MSREHCAFLDEFPQTKDDRQPLWKPKDTALKPEAKICGAPPPPGSCEFVGDLPYEGALCRKCTLGSICFLFAEPAAYASCPSRIERLRELKREKT